MDCFHCLRINSNVFFPIGFDIFFYFLNTWRYLAINAGHSVAATCPTYGVTPAFLCCYHIHQHKIAKVFECEDALPWKFFFFSIISCNLVKDFFRVFYVFICFYRIILYIYRPSATFALFCLQEPTLCLQRADSLPRSPSFTCKDPVSLSAKSRLSAYKSRLFFRASPTFFSKFSILCQFLYNIVTRRYKGKHKHVYTSNNFY